MMSRSTQLGFLVLLMLGSAAASGRVCAQDPQEPQPTPVPENGPPKPAARGLPGLEDSNDQNVDQWQPDISPVTGLQAPTLGTPSLRHSYWVPGAQYAAMVQSNPFGATGSSNWSITNFLGANFSLVKSWTGSILNLNWSGGGVFTTEQGLNNGSYQQLGASQSFVFHRWQWQWSDQFAYLPESQFGFGVGTGLGTAGVGGTLGAAPSITASPGQSILSAFGPEYSNVATVQGTYLLNGRQSVTLAGMDELLRFTQANNVDSNIYLGSIGYNYALSKEDSIGLSYRFTSYHFPGQPQAYGSSWVSVAYQRKITQRLALRVTGGPNFVSYRVPLGGISKQTSGQADATLTYGTKKGGLSAYYFHGLTAGSGVLIGGNLDQITFSGNRRVTRVWTVNGNFGYARNRALNQALAQQLSTSGLGNYDDWFVGGGASRPFGRNVNLGLSYAAYIQRASASNCTGPNCTSDSTTHTITVFLSWHARPFVIE